MGFTKIFPGVIYEVLYGTTVTSYEKLEKDMFQPKIAQRFSS
jgi:hypothetical protein